VKKKINLINHSINQDAIKNKQETLRKSIIQTSDVEDR